MSGIAQHPCNAPHGTRARYVGARCRCNDCRRANTEYYHRRQTAKDEAAPSVTPSGPPGEARMLRGGRQVKILTCPGANGARCVRSPAPWLKGQVVCTPCVERATVWNGNVPAGPVRDHLMKLRRASVGYKSVAAACDVSASVLSRVLAGEGTIRASTAKRVLAVDAGARADGAVAPEDSVARMRCVLEHLLEAGFRKHELAWLLGSSSKALQIGRTGGALVSSVAAVDRLWRKWERGEIRPRLVFVEAAPVYAQIRELVTRGLDQRWLSKRLGFTVHLAHEPKGMWPENAAAVAELVEEIARRRREGEPLDDGWQQTKSEHRVEGWGLDQRISKAAKKRERAELRRLAQTAAPRVERFERKLAS